MGIVDCKCWVYELLDVVFRDMLDLLRRAQTTQFDQPLPCFLLPPLPTAAFVFGVCRRPEDWGPVGRPARLWGQGRREGEISPSSKPKTRARPEEGHRDARGSLVPSPIVPDTYSPAVQTVPLLGPPDSRCPLHPGVIGQATSTWPARNMSATQRYEEGERGRLRAGFFQPWVCPPLVDWEHGRYQGDLLVVPCAADEPVESFRPRRCGSVDFQYHGEKKLG
ncbi:uncharacterized protein P884DRAFT_266126 [Thermothelomyces heterothallicus CBS 202.75]|uniref:uncharacterized protein n=1 Tax=Thermothelomyces heterothallicus CBS 202.75 TaxID=1149848 RepID=UPI003741F962